MALRTILLSGLVFAVSIGDGLGQQPSDSREAAAMAVELQKKGDWEGGYNLATQTLAACPDDDTGLSCRLRMLYTVGFVFEQAASGERRQEFLEKASDYYAAVIDKSPNHAATTRRLAVVYEQLGQLDKAEATIRSIQGERDKREVSRSAIQLGDLYVRRQAWDEARQQYRRALGSSHDADLARRRLLFVYRNQPNTSELLGLAQGWEVEAPASAADAYLLLIEQTYREPNQRELSVDALQSWVGLVAEMGDVQQAMQNLPGDFNGREISDLRAYVEEPRRKPQNSWWLGSPKRRHMLAKLSLALGDDVKLTKGKPAWSLRCWRVGLDVSPETQMYFFDRELKDKTSVRLELQTAIARVIGLRPDLDPDGSRLRAIEQEIFQGKGASYSRGDYRAIQQHHTVLGLIYARQGRWTSQRGDSGAANGIFQLEHALRTARMRTRSGDAPYAPFPKLRSELATGYIETRQTENARRMLLEAAKDYLDTADSVAALRPAQAELKRFGALEGTIPPRQAADARILAAWIRLRSRAGAQALAERVVGNPKYDPVAELAGRISPLIDDQFVSRQTFKFHADLAATLQRQQSEPAAQAAARLGAQAVDQAVRSGNLIGAGDLVRLRQAQSAMSPVLAGGGYGLPVAGQAAHDSSEMQSVSLVRGGGEQNWVSIPKQTVVTAQVAQEIGAQRLIESKVVVSRSRSGEVVLRGSPAAVRQIEAETRRVAPNRTVKSGSVERLKRLTR
jgi:tetratricopeptide (TPR) repeat protein